MPKPAKPKKPRAVVRFTFAPHTGNSFFLKKPLRKSTQVLLIEKAGRGVKAHRISSAEELENLYRFNAGFKERAKKTVKEALGRGVEVRVAEATKDFQIESDLLSAESRLEQAEKIVFSALSINSIKNFFKEFAKVIELRHRMVVENLAEQIEKGKTDIHVRLGTAHSVLAKKARKELGKKARIEKETHQKVFGFDEEIVRKLLNGKKLSSMSRLELKKGFLSYMLLTSTDFPRMIIGKPVAAATPSQLEFYSIGTRELLKNLNEKQIDSIFRHPDRPDYKILEFNKVPGIELDKQTRKHFRAWLKKRKGYQRWKKQKS